MNDQRIYVDAKNHIGFALERCHRAILLVTASIFGAEKLQTRLYYKRIFSNVE